MKTHVAVYKSHENALHAIEALSNKKFPIDKVSMIEKANIVEDHIKVKSLENIKIIPILITTFIGVILGILASLDVLVFPGFAFLNEEPPFIAGFVGFDIGLLVGGILIIFIAILVKKDKTVEVQKHAENTNYFIVVDGSLEDIKNAENILNTEGTHNYRLYCTYCNDKKASLLKVN